MGSGSSREYVPPSNVDEAAELAKKLGSTSTGVHAHTKNGEGAAGQQEGPRLLGKNKYVKDYGALAMTHCSRSGACLGTLFLFCARTSDELVFSYRDAHDGTVYMQSFTDAALAGTKNAYGVRFSWAPFFKSLASALIKSKAVVSSPKSGTVSVNFIIENSKEPAHTYPFAVQLRQISHGDYPDPVAVFNYVVEPLTRVMQYNHRRASISEREGNVARLACETAVRTSSIEKYKRTVERLMPLIRPLREESAVYSNNAMNAAREVRNLERRIHALQEKPIMKHPLDALYDEGGAQFFKHVSWSTPHQPHEEEPDDILTACIRAAFPLAEGATLQSISQVLTRPELKSRIESSGRQRIILEAFEIFKGIDQWDYDTIQLEIITNGNALFYTTYLLMYKLDLVSYFHIDDAVLCNFLTAVQASYHPNPYHNAMHGADVTQINYYIMMVAGLCQRCKLSKEEILAGLVAGAVHDFDHPGLNNNFHTRTNAYLATLYNDRSILENHHVACTFELLRNPRYNIFASLSDAQRLVVRETMVEMVLATDMGQHATIFKNFQVRMSTTTDWSAKREDVRLALSMSIKMADVSNCARPNHIYAEWAKNITNEFYLQGDAERSLGLTISPFMDRTKAEEFPKGQISFMMYIVQPMVEALSELLPSMRFAIALCNDNKAYWKRLTEAEQEAQET